MVSRVHKVASLSDIAEYDKPVSGGDGEKTSLAYIQLEKHNERLKDALIRCVARLLMIYYADTADYAISPPRMRKKAKPKWPISRRN